MYKIKQLPEDFVVNEVLDLNLNEKGQYSYYKLSKTNFNTVTAVLKIADYWKFKPKFINFAGTKDKVAVTTQFISISRGPQKDIDLKDINVKYLGKGDERLNLGTLKGNNFEITIRNITRKPSSIKRIRNLFDSQRFGIKNNNHIIGKHIIKKEFKVACEIINDYKLKVHLKGHINDYVGALKRIPKKILMLYINAYQSHLWNEMIQNSNEEKLPLIGFNTDETDVVKEILKREGITLRDFIIRPIPELSQEGDDRKVFVDVKNLEIGELEDDELNLSKKKVLIKFFLTKGSYATQVIKQMFNYN
ncbi:tRNA pseudouridine(13) synthase TruD [Candidatus Woesearchaeota archaeon]|jgi:tRNA pseudouridine13 synthase|nr:tRNA pseudouridine(13) synthase TruD [Candidatus Woesearchaeota archaeon]